MRRSRQRGLSPVTAAVLAIVVVVAGVYLAFTKSVPFRHHYTVHLAFRSANNIKPNSFVRIAGVNVGRVTKVRVLHPGQPGAIVDVRLDKRALPLHTDAQATIRPRIFLEGNFFVDLKPGSPSAPKIGDGGTIPVQQTHTPVQLDQILTTLQSSTRDDLKVLLREYSQGLAHGGARSFNRAIPYFKGAYRDSSIVNDATLGTTDRDLSGYIANAGATAAALDRNSVQLKDLITDFNTTAGALASRQGALAEAIGELPRTLQTGRPALKALDQALPPLRRLVAALRPAVRSTGPAIDDTLPFIRQARGLVSEPELRGLTSDLRPTVPGLAKAQAETPPLYEQVRAASSCQNKVILPWTQDTIDDKTFPAIGPVYQEAVKPLVGLSGESRSGDANGQWFRVLVSGGQYSYPMGLDKVLLTNQPVMGVNPPTPAQRAPLRPNVPCETQEPPDLRTDPGAAPTGGSRVADPPADVLKAGQDAAVSWLRKQLSIEGLSDELGVKNVAVTASQLPQLRALGQLPGGRR